MDVLTGLLTLASIFIAIVILDYLWLGRITHKFIIRQFGSLVKVKEGVIQINLAIGLVTWFMIALGCFIFAVMGSEALVEAIGYGALFGFIAYAIYDLTNLTFIHKYPVKFVFVDIAWGTFLCSAISAVGFLVRSGL